MGRRSHELTTDDCKAISVAEKPTATTGSKNCTALTPSSGQTPIAPEVMKRLSGCKHFLKLSLRRQRFVLECVKEKDYNITRAYRNAYGCDGESARANSGRLMANDDVQAALREVSQIVIEEKALRTAYEVESALDICAFFNPKDYVDEEGRIRELKDLTDAQALAVQEIETFTTKQGTVTKLRFVNRLDAIGKKMKRLGMLVDRLEKKEYIESYEEIRKRLGLDE